MLQRQGGNFSIAFALLLPLLIGFAALVVDLGRFWHVRRELQIAADAAALAGARDLDGTSAGFPLARLATQTYAAHHDADKSGLALDLNAGNAAAGDIVLGHWDPVARIFAPAGAMTEAHLVNAVKAVGRRTRASGGAVQPFFARILGAADKDLTATAIAVAGSPGSACGFPVAIPRCALFPRGVFECPVSMTFRGGSGDKDAGFTLLGPDHPSASSIREYIHQALSGCARVSTTDGDIYLQNGNDLPRRSVDEINHAVARAGADGLFVNVPVVDYDDCSQSS